MEDDATATLHQTHAPPASARAMLRHLEQVLGAADRMRFGASALAPLLEHRTAGDPPRIAASDPLEDAHVREITPATESGIVAFLDGVQRTRLVGHVGLAPVILGEVAAVIRERHDRRMHTWGAPVTDRFFLASRRALGAASWDALQQRGLRLENVDGTSTDDVAHDADAPVHPLMARARALDIAGAARERAEAALAIAWSRGETRWLWIDGAISGISELAIEHTEASPNVFGVIKSHSTLYGTPSMVQAALALPAGHRSPGMFIRHRLRQPVLSWYLRLRCSDDGDPLHGLVRVELPATASTKNHVTALADGLSAWILLERSPVSLPDARWDRLAYGVRDCERYLSSHRRRMTPSRPMPHAMSVS